MIVTTSNIHSKTRPMHFGVAVCCAVLSSSLLANRGQAQSVPGESASDLVILEVPAEVPVTAQLIGSGSTRIASRRALVTEPTLQAAQEAAVEPPSPSDSKAAQAGNPADKTDQPVDAGQVDNTTDKSTADKTKQDGSNAPVPVQSRTLRLEITTVNTKTSEVGTGMIPDNIAANNAPPIMGLPDGFARGFVPEQVNWQPADICHFPPYFEDAMLERHGQVRWGCAQPLVSGAKFLTTIPMLPYLTTMHPPCEPRYSLGHFRPGTCAPVLKDYVPWDRRAATVQVLSSAAFWVAAPL